MQSTPEGPVTPFIYFMFSLEEEGGHVCVVALMSRSVGKAGVTLLLLLSTLCPCCTFD